MTTDQQTRTYRASRAPLYWLCPAAAHGEDDAVLIDPVDDAGTMGAAVHEAAAMVALGNTPDPGGLAMSFGFDENQRKELEILIAVARQFWREYGPQFGNTPEVELELRATDGVAMTGHCDVVGQREDTVRVLDWKTTRLETVNYRAQMMQYLWLLWQAPQSPFGRPGEHYQYTICFLRDKTIEVSKQFTAEEVSDWHAEYMERIEQWDGQTYCPGGHCTYCPRSACCPALEQRLALTVRSLRPSEETAMAEKIDALTDDECVLTYERIRLAEKMLGEAVELIKLRAARQEGTLQGDGKALVLKEHQRQTIRAREAWPVVLNHLTEAELAPAVSISKTELLDAVGAKAPRGHKKRIKEQLMKELQAAGAVETSTYRVPRIVLALPAATETAIETQESED